MRIVNTDLEGIEPSQIVLKTIALPLCYKSIYSLSQKGFEPSTVPLSMECYNQLSYRLKKKWRYYKMKAKYNKKNSVIKIISKYIKIVLVNNVAIKIPNKYKNFLFLIPNKGTNNKINKLKK